MFLFDTSGNGLDRPWQTTLHILDGPTGAVLLEQPLGEPAYGKVSTEGGGPLFLAADPDVIALDPATGDVIWRRDDVSRVKAVSFSPDGGLIAIGSSGRSAARTY